MANKANYLTEATVSTNSGKYATLYLLEYEFNQWPIITYCTFKNVSLVYKK